MENNKITIEISEQDLTFLLECVTVVSQVKWKGYNSKVEPLRQLLLGKRNALVQGRIDTLKAQILELEKTKNETK